MGQLRIWAENDVYGSGHGSHTGNPNKVDPGDTITADGLVPGEEFDARHLNHQLHEHSLAALQARNATLRSWEEIVGASFSSAFQSLGSVYLAHLGLSGFQINGTFYLVADTVRASSQGSNNVDIIENVLIYDPVTQRIVVAGTGTDRSAYSDDDGANWTTSTTETSITPGLGLYLKENTYMIAPQEGSTATGRVEVTFDGGDNWAIRTAVTPTTDDATRGLARCGMVDNAVIVFTDNSDFFSADETDNYTAWTDRGRPPDFADLTKVGWAASDSAGVCYFVGGYSDGLRVYSKASPSSAWQQIALIDVSNIPGYTGSYPVGIVLLVDDPTDAMHVLVRHADTTSIFSSLDRGVTWAGPGTILGNQDSPVFAAKGGRLWHRPVNASVLRTAVELEEVL